MNRWLVAIGSLAVVGGLASVPFISDARAKRKVESERAAVQRNIDALAEQRRSTEAALRDEWARNQAYILARIDAELAAGRSGEAVTLVAKYDPVAGEAMADAKRRTQAAFAKDQAALRARQERETAAVMVASRKAYAQTLRTHFLDDALDIKVSTRGADAKILVLEYPLFGDVWEHKIGNGDLLEEIWRQGFVEVRMSDGYDWSGGWRRTN